MFKKQNIDTRREFNSIMSKILIIYATTDGQTRKISQRLQQVIEQQSHQVALVPVEDAASIDLASFDKIVIGASIRYGKHSPLIVDFIEKNRALLESKPNAFFSVNVVARKPEKCRPEDNPYLQKFLRRISWQPRELAVFAGKIDYPSYRPIDRFMIRLIMWMTKGPTDPTAVIEFTDWQQVESFGKLVSAM
jgi:menaquinone-dependent protoporphyrinogen oxidase